MTKKNTNCFILIIFILIGIFTPISANLTKVHAEGEASITVIPNDMNFSISQEGGVVLSGVDDDVSSGMKALLNFIRLLSGVGALVMLMIFVINFVKLGASGTNANARAGAISALVWSGIATACLSMSTVIFFFFFRMNDSVKETTQNQKN